MLATVQDSVGLTVAASLQNGDTAETAHAAVTPGHHYRLRAKVQQTDASVATVVPLVWYNTASGAVDVPGTLVDPTPKDVPLTAEWVEWEWVAPDDAIAVRMSMEFTVTAGPLGTIGLAAPGIFSMTDGSLVVDGSIIAREVLTADPGGPLVHVFDGAVNVYGPERVDEDGQPIRDVWLNMGNDDAGGGNFGPGDNLWRAPDPTDPELASSSINKQGDAEFLSVSARDDMFIGGESVKAALTEAVQPALLVMDSRYQTQVRGPYSTRTGVWRWGMSAKAGHRYTTMFTFRIDTTADWFDATIHKNESAPGTTPTQPSVSSPAMQTKRIIHGNGTQAFYYNVEYSFNPGFDEETAWLLSINTTSASSNPWTIREFVVRMTDWGVGPDNTGYATTGGAAETPPTRWMDKYFYFDRHRTWSNNGRLTDGRWNPWWVRTGLGGSSLYRGYLLLSSADRAKIMASDEVPSSIGLELDVASGWGGKPYLGTHNSSSVDTAEPSYANRAYTSNSAPASAGAVTFYLNAQQRTNLHNGHWGIYLGPQSGSKIIDFKGTNDPQSPSGAYSSTVVPRIKVRGKWAN